MSFMNKLIFWIIPLVVLVILVIAFFGEESMFEGLKLAAKDVQDINPFGIGAENVTPEKPTIPIEHQEAIVKLKSTIEQMKSSEGNCFMNYQVKDYGTGSGLPNLGEKGTSIVFKPGVENEYLMVVMGGEQGAMQVSREKLSGFKPCVIAGKTHSGLLVSDMFHNNFLKDPIVKGGSSHLPVSSVTIQYDGSNKIIYGSKSGDLKDSGWLFTPGGGYICFFPSFSSTGSNNPFQLLNPNNWGCNSAEPGLDEDCMAEFSRLVGFKKLSLCSREEKPRNVITIDYALTTNDVSFLFNREKKVWEYNAILGWHNVNDFGGQYIKPYKKIAKNLSMMNEEEGYEYFRDYLLPSPGRVLKVEGVPGKMKAPPSKIRVEYGWRVTTVDYIYDRNVKKWQYKGGKDWGYVEDISSIYSEENEKIADDLDGRNEEEGYEYFRSEIEKEGLTLIEGVPKPK